LEDTHLAAEKDYISGMKYKQIAEKYGVSINTVKSWKVRYQWQKGVHTKQKKVCTQKKYAGAKNEDGTRETISNDELSEKEQYFCIFYSRSFNATQSYIKSFDSTYNTAKAEGYKLLAKPCVKKEIERLKEIKRQQIVCGEADIVEMHMRIAFADMGDYMKFNEKGVTLLDSRNADTSMIQEVRQQGGSVTVRLADKHKSLDFLERYFMVNPMDKHRVEYDRRMMELKSKEPDTANINDNMQALADILMSTRRNRTIEELEGGGANEHDSTAQ